MKDLFLFILSIISALQAQQMIADFRPDALGNVWEYSWQNEPYNRRDPFIEIGESLHVTVTLNDYEMEGIDTLYLFRIHEKGIVTTVYQDSTTKTRVENLYTISVYFKFNVSYIIYRQACKKP